MSEPSSPQEDVMSLTAHLAERQAAATQLPRLSSGPLGSPDHKRAASNQDGEGTRGRPMLTTTGDAAKTNNRESIERSGAPKMNEAAIREIMTRIEGDDDEAKSTAEASSSSQIARLRAGNRSVPSSSPEKALRRSTTSSSSSKRKARMTVLMDEEVPSDGETDRTANGSIGEAGDTSVKTKEGGNEGNEEEEEEAEEANGQAEPLTDASHSEILEQDADEGDGEVDEDGDAKTVAREEKAQQAQAKDQVNATENEKPRLMDTIATLRAMHPSSSQHESLAAGESFHDQQDTEGDEEEPTLKYSRLKGSVPDVLKKDSASSIAVSDRILALGTHSGAIYILDEQGNLIKGFRSHSASVLDLVIDTNSDFVAGAGMDGIVSISSLSSSESYSFDFKRVMRTVALEPSFGRRSTRSFVCGGMAGQLVLREKSWFGHRETIIHEGEGPIWTTKWKGNMIAWATDKGVRVYDAQTRQRIGLISPPIDSPRADLFRCSLVWQDDSTLLIAWADHVKIAKIRQRKKKQTTTPAAASASPLQHFVEVTAILQLDCMISGIAPRGQDFLILAYITEDSYSDSSSIVDDREAQKRKEGLRPELRLISNDGEELSSDALSLESFARFQCNDYLLVPSADAVLSAARAIASPSSRSNGKGPNNINQSLEDFSSDYFYVVSPKDIVIARSRDDKDHVDWLLEHRYYHDALESVKTMGTEKAVRLGFNEDDIGREYLAHLIEVKQDFAKAAEISASILKGSARAWEDLVFAFIEKQQLLHLIPMVPIEDPTLSGVVYDMILAHFLRFDLTLLYDTIKRWPPEIYSIKAVVLAIEDRLEREQSAKKLLMECLAEVYIKNRQPGKALPYFLRLRKPGVFDLIREHNLFTVVQDQALLLVEFEQDNEQQERTSKHGAAIDLLVDHTHSIPIHRVVPQLQSKPRYLYRYLDALFDLDPQQVADYADLQVKLYAEFEYTRLMPYLRAMSSFYSFEKAYNICKEHDYVPEMVFLLSRIGDNKTALTLIIERLQDVERAIDFVKEEKDADLWEDLLKYSENRPKFIKGLLENIGSEVDAVKLIRRIKNGLEIEGLKTSLVKILSDFNLQISLLEGCQAILSHDGRTYSHLLHQGQSLGQYCDKENSRCDTCGLLLFAGGEEIGVLFRSIAAGGQSHHSLEMINNVLFLCRHRHHISCLVSNLDSVPKFASPGDTTSTTAASKEIPTIRMNTTQALASGNQHAFLQGSYGPKMRTRQIHQEDQDRLRYQNRLRVVLKQGCPICRRDHDDATMAASTAAPQIQAIAR